MNLRKEKGLWKKGFQLVAGLDEAGRGPLAGPVIAAAVVFVNPKSEIRSSKQILNSKFEIPNQLKGVNDSKKLSAKKREELYEILISHPLIIWAVGRAGPRVIDRINILQATKLAMKRALKSLELGTHNLEPDFLILDGRMKLNLDIPEQSIVRADAKIFSCAAASIICKVIRDRAMRRYHRQYPEYGFDRHKGYPTRHHRKMLKRYGPCKIHRRSFKPVRKLVKK